MSTTGSSNVITTSQGFPRYTPDFEWKFYRALVENYFATVSISDVNRQKTLFFAHLPKQLLNLVCFLIDLRDLPSTSMVEILGCLDLYFETQNSVLVRRLNLVKTKREAQESIAHYAKGLKAQISCCDLGPETNSQLCECFVQGLNYERLQKMLSGYDGENFEDLVERALFVDSALCGEDGDIRGGGDTIKESGTVKAEVSACDFKDFGCDFKGSVKEMEQHILEFSSKHVQMSHSSLQRKIETHELAVAKQIIAYKQQVDQQLMDQKQLIDKQNRRIKGLDTFEFLWCITGVAAHIKAALADSKHAVYSDPFYTHHNGYCMSASLELNSENMKLKQVNIFLHLEPGKCDAILEWPMNKKKVNIIVQDQSEGKLKKHVVKSFHLNISDFKQPVTVADLSDGIGPVEFVTLDFLQKFFIKKDRLFISVSVGDP